MKSTVPMMIMAVMMNNSLVGMEAMSSEPQRIVLSEKITQSPDGGTCSTSTSVIIGAITKGEFLRSADGIHKKMTKLTTLRAKRNVLITALQTKFPKQEYESDKDAYDNDFCEEFEEILNIIHNAEMQTVPVETLRNYEKMLVRIHFDTAKYQAEISTLRALLKLPTSKKRVKKNQ